MSLVVDNFAGGGGASSGIEAALGRSVDFAINHDPEAIAMHRVNHPDTVHLCSSVWDVNPTKLAAGRRVGLGWFSPDCTFHSKARGGKPFRDRNMARRRRGLANLIPRWAATNAAPQVICLENVEEFADWGPLLPDGRICPKRRGMLFRRWHRQLENLGYRIDMRELKACDYGAPTTRKRLFIVMRRDGGEIIFPEATHGPWNGCEPYRTAAECIDWSIPCPSIFDRKRPLAEATLRRIARGVMRYVVNNPQPFIVPLTHQGADRAYPLSGQVPTVTAAHRGELALVSPVLTEHANASNPRSWRTDEPLRTICANVKGGHFAMVSAFLAKHYGGVVGHELPRPIGTVTTVDHHSLVTANLLHLRNNCDGRAVDDPLRTVSAQGQHHALVASHLMKYYGTDQDPRIDEPLGTVTTKDRFAEVRAFLLRFYGQSKEAGLTGPLDTITTKDRFGLVTVHGEPYQIVDIGMRMLTPRELYRAQGFRPDYIIEHGRDEHGELVELTKTAQVRMCGNSVSPACAEALVRANYVEQRQRVAA